MKSRIIIVGPSASGKNYLKETFVKKGFSPDVSYTSRKPRESEVDGKHYVFLSLNEFYRMIQEDEFYEWVKYKDNLYGTGLTEWKEREIFIMETIGVSKLTPEDRKSSLVIYLNPHKDSRIKRMALERSWKWPEIAKRLDFDQNCFADFSDYDITITNSDF